MINVFLDLALTIRIFFSSNQELNISVSGAWKFIFVEKTIHFLWRMFSDSCTKWGTYN